jgi:hypothetical protein
MAVKYNSSSVLGVDFNNTSTGALFTVGQKVLGSDNSEWVYVYSTSTLTTGCLAVVKASGTAILANLTAVCTAYGQLAFAQGAFVAGEYGWLAVRGGVGAGGPMKVSISSTCAVAVALYVALTSGALSTTESSATLQGVQLVTATTVSGVQTTDAVLTYPRTVQAAYGAG